MESKGLAPLQITLLTKDDDLPHVILSFFLCKSTILNHLTNLMMIAPNSIVTQKVSLDLKNEIELYIKREDQNHKQISGNKLRKLKYNLIEAQKQGFDKIITFGGAYSNHILATAAAGKMYGMQTIGVIRGDELSNCIEQNPTLSQAQSYGMIFHFVSRKDYREKHTFAFQKHLKKMFGTYYLVPEGGTNTLAVKGCQEILTPQDAIYDFVTTAVGTGGTISGLINSCLPHQQVLGFPALKGDFLHQEISKYTNATNWRLITDYHLGGYAKINDFFIDFLNDFYTQTLIPLDPIYTGKMIWGILDLIEKDYFPAKSKILAIHTGGLQGIVGMNQKLKKHNKNHLVYETEIN